MANVTWNGGSGVWDTATLWSTGAIPGAADAVTIDAGGSYTVTLNGTADAAASILLNSAAATLSIQGTLALGGTLAPEAGTLELAGRPASTAARWRCKAAGHWSARAARSTGSPCSGRWR